jgi:hypothetical protein
LIFNDQLDDVPMWRHEILTHKDLKNLLQNSEIQLAGNMRLKVYGLLTCTSGKRMKKENRVFFKNETEAIQLGFRPCGHCLRKAYAKWKLLS